MYPCKSYGPYNDSILYNFIMELEKNQKVQLAKSFKLIIEHKQQTCFLNHTCPVLFFEVALCSTEAYSPFYIYYIQTGLTKKTYLEKLITKPVRMKKKEEKTALEDIQELDRIFIHNLTHLIQIYHWQKDCPNHFQPGL